MGCKCLSDSAHMQKCTLLVINRPAPFFDPVLNVGVVFVHRVAWLHSQYTKSRLSAFGAVLKCLPSTTSRSLLPTLAYRPRLCRLMRSIRLCCVFNFQFLCMHLGIPGGFISLVQMPRQSGSRHVIPYSDCLTLPEHDTTQQQRLPRAPICQETNARLKI